jgi:PAS domain S-box-containing protein
MTQSAILVDDAIRLAKLTALMPGMVCQFRLFKDGTCTFPYASAGITEIFRLQPDDIRTDGTKLFELIHPDDLVRINAAVRESATHLTPILEKFRICYKDGTCIWAESRAQPERLDDGSVLWHSYVGNIDKQVRTEETSARREVLFRKMADASPVFMWMFGPKGRLDYINTTYLTFLGRDLHDMLAGAWRDCAHPDEIGPEYERFMECMKAREPFESISRMRRHDGVYRTLANWARPWFHDDGALGGYIGSGIDITDQKAAQDQVVNMNDKLDSILTSLPEVVYSMSTDRMQYFFIGSATAHVYQRPPAEFMQDPDLWFKVIHPNDLSSIDGFMDNLHRHGLACAEYRILRPDGSIAWVIDKARIIRDPSGMALRVDGVVADITNRVETDAKLNKARQDAEAASRHKSEFLASMSHEIRTPMTAIVGYSHLLTSGRPTPQEQTLWNANIRRNSDYLLNLVNDILDLSKIEAGQVELQLQPVSPSDIVENVLQLMGPTAREKLLTLSLIKSGKIPTRITADSTRLGQILVNLVSNAIKFTDHGHICLEMSSQSDPVSSHTQLLFSITDTGIGIPPDKLERLFKPFSRVPQGNTGTIRPGTGLGLVIALKFAQMMNGGITVESQPAKGSRFTVTIDAGLTETLEFSEDAIPPESWPADQHTPLTQDALTGARILVTDDNPDNQRIIQFILEQSGAVVELANHGQEATDRILKPANRPPIDLIIMDMQMPVCDGYTATQILRSKGFTLPIVAVTAYTMAGDKQKCLKAGCTSYLTKPVVPDVLVQELSKFLTARKDQPAPASPPPQGNPALAAMLANPRFARLVKQYVAGLEETRSLILLHLDKSEFEPLRVLCHRLKGSGSSYGFPDITNAAANCEAAIKTGLPPVDIARLAQALITKIIQAQTTPDLT